MLKTARILIATPKPPEGIYLNIPFKEKDEAKGLGRPLWDEVAKKWWCRPQDLQALAKWADPKDTAPVEAVAPVAPKLSLPPNPEVPPYAVYLKVPYADRFEASKRGAEFDKINKRWYAPNSSALTGWLGKWANPKDQVKDEDFIDVYTEEMQFFENSYIGLPKSKTLRMPKNAIILYHESVQYVNMKKSRYQYALVTSILGPDIDVKNPIRHAGKLYDYPDGKYDREIRAKAEELSKQMNLPILEAWNWVWNK